MIQKKGLSELIAPKFHDVYRANMNRLVSETLLKGGRASTKSSCAAIMCIMKLLHSTDENVAAFVKNDNRIKDTAFTTALWAIDMLGAHQDFIIRQSPYRIIKKSTGQVMSFHGLDDPTKLKSIKPRVGYYSFLWFEEAASFDSMEQIRNVQQSFLRGGEHGQSVLTYNPPNDPNNWLNKEVKVEEEVRLIHHSTYLDIPAEWLGPVTIKAAERLRRRDKLAYDHEYMGETVGNPNHIVFFGKWEEKAFDEPDMANVVMNRFFYGADWGFAQDPTAIVRCFIRDECLYVDYESGGVGVEFEDLPDLFDKVPGIRQWPVIADSNRPETISYMSRKGYDISGVEKWTGIVEDSITYMKGFRKIYVHPRCTQLIKELTYLSYKVDNNTDEVLPKLKDGQADHYFDAVRYAIVRYIKQNVSIFDAM